MGSEGTKLGPTEGCLNIGASSYGPKMFVRGQDGGDIGAIGDRATDVGAIDDNRVINRAFNGTAAVIVTAREGDDSINNGRAEGGKTVSLSGVACVGSSELSAEANSNSMKNLRNSQELH